MPLHQAFYYPEWSQASTVPLVTARTKHNHWIPKQIGMIHKAKQQVAPALESSGGRVRLGSSYLSIETHYVEAFICMSGDVFASASTETGL